MIIGLIAGFVMGAMAGWMLRGWKRTRMLINSYLRRGLHRGVTDQYVKALDMLYKNPAFELFAESFALVIYSRYSKAELPKTTEQAWVQVGYRMAGAHIFEMIENVKEIDDNGRRNKENLERNLAAGIEGDSDF